MIGKAREQMKGILDNFMRRNGNYAIEIYICNANSDLTIGKLLIPIERSCNHDKNDVYNISWGLGNSIDIPYKEVIACYEERDGDISETVYVIMKCGLIMDICCVGLRL